MARPREFSTGEALERATQVFWRQGYEASSLADLTAAMGISKSSLYETFGSKHALFLSAIGHYEDTVTEAMVAGLDGEASGRRAIDKAFARLVDRVADEGDLRGCFLANCTSERVPRDAQAAARIKHAMGRIEGAFERAVARGQKAGEIAAGAEPRALARYLNSTYNGLLVVAKANPDRQALDDVVRTALSALA